MTSWQILENLLKLSNWAVNNDNRLKALSATEFFELITTEFKEAQDELKKNNTVYLEDELGDLLWTIIQALGKLQQEGYITDTQKVFERCLAKYQPRLDAIKDKPLDENYMSYRNAVKEQQKTALQKEHREKYK